MEYIIANGLNSIRVGLEDFERATDGQDDARLTSAVRNVFAGILLLAKGKLYELSPPESRGILIRVVRPKLVDGRVEVQSVGKRTIDYAEIKKRFNDCQLRLDWDRLERIHDIRNELEHFYHGGPRSTVQEALSDAAVVVRSLLEHLRLDPIHALGEQPWRILLRSEALFEAELSACRETFAGVNWINRVATAAAEHFSCWECSSPLIRQLDTGNTEQDDVHPQCAACGAESDVRSLLERAVQRQYFRELYETQTRGGELPVVRCPSCRSYALVLEPNQCAACDHRLDETTLWCEHCHNPMSAQEKQSGKHDCPIFYPH